MKKIKNLSEYIATLIPLLRLTLLALPVALLTGSVVAGFLAALDLVTDLRFAHTWLLYLLPLTGLLIWLLYRYTGRNAEGGNNLILEEIQETGAGVPARMGPLVLLTTLLTHLTGGSAGREGTAVQIGGSIAAMFAKCFRLPPADVKMMLLMGIAAGFGAVFGTPLAGAVFAIEVAYIGRMHYKALLPCLIAALLADAVCTAWGMKHTLYAITGREFLEQRASFIHFNAGLLGKVLIAGACFGLTSRLFSAAVHYVKAYSNRLIAHKWLIPVLGGLIIIGMAMLPGGKDYLGLGVHNPDPAAVTIVSAFHPGGAHAFSWLWKIIFTAITLGMGFKGGEVTPLFFTGATLGYSLGMLMGVPVDLMAAIGFIAVFAGAANTPVACVLMGMELFGGHYMLYFAAACFMAYYFSGTSGIYQSQRLNRHKMGLHDYPGGRSLKELRQERYERLKKWWQL
jgi:H+/Cl- antiporter ClcA